jgi:hypothetical protein
MTAIVSEEGPKLGIAGIVMDLNVVRMIG